MNWNFGRWLSSLSWPGLAAMLVHLLHKFGEHGPPWDVFNFIGGGP
jgi:hypothetical protein